MSAPARESAGAAGTVAPADSPANGPRPARLGGAAGDLAGQFTRYIVVGGVAFVADLGALYLLTEFAGLHYLASAAAAFVIGLVTNYALCRLWVFDRRTVSNGALEFAVFAAIGVVGLAMNEAIIWIVTDKIHLHYTLSKAVSAAVVLLWNFGARKLILFR